MWSIWSPWGVGSPQDHPDVGVCTEAPATGAPNISAHVIAAAIAAAIIVMAVAAPVLAPYEPLKSDFRSMSKPPNERHYFGTDQIGRDTQVKLYKASLGM